jgi:uncharacterized protein GlcG (DUF336 family)
MCLRLTVWLASLCAVVTAETAVAQRFVPNFSSATALTMAQACIAYAGAHNGAVNVWIFNDRRELLHFQRMDGAPQLGPSFSSGRQYGGDPFQNGPGPVVPIPDTSAVGGVPVVINGMTVAYVQAEGMGAVGDRACAEAAIQAAQQAR